MNLQRPQHVPGFALLPFGVGNTRPTDDELIHLADDRDHDPLVRALAAALEEARTAIDGAKAEAREAEKRADEEESRADAAEGERDNAIEAADAFRDLLDEVVQSLHGMVDGELVERIKDARAAHPSEAEKAAAERERKAKEAAMIAEAVAGLPGFAALWPGDRGSLVTLRYKVQRGRVWRNSSLTCRLFAEQIPALTNAYHSILRQHPGASVSLALA